MWGAVEHSIRGHADASVLPASTSTAFNEAQRPRPWVDHQHRRGISWRTVQPPIGASTDANVLHASTSSACNEAQRLRPWVDHQHRGGI